MLAGIAVQTPRLPASAHDVQIPVHAPAQQTPCWHEPDAHSVPAAQSTPLTFLPQIVPLQTLPPEQSALVAHEVRHAPAVPQEYGSHACCVPGMHVPVPLQRPGRVAVTPVQAGATHCVPEAYSRQAALPSHMPSLPQVAAPWSAHWPSGSAPSGTLVQVPMLPGTAHDRQVPAQAPPQQTPCSQKLELHSGPPPQAAPIGFLPQLPLMQLLGARQSVSPVQIVRQRLSAAQLNGAHDWPGVDAQVPLPSQRNADVSVEPVHPISLQTVPAGYLSQAPVPSHIPVEPHVDAASTGALVARIGAELGVDAGPDGALTRAGHARAGAGAVATDAVGAEPGRAFAADRARAADRLAGRLDADVGGTFARITSAAGDPVGWRRRPPPRRARHPGRRPRHAARRRRRIRRSTRPAPKVAARTRTRLLDPGLTHPHPRGKRSESAVSLQRSRNHCIDAQKITSTDFPGNCGVSGS